MSSPFGMVFRMELKIQSKRHKNLGRPLVIWSQGKIIQE